MPTVVRKTRETIMEVRRGILHSVSWQVKSSLWDPPTDLYETEDTYIVRMEITRPFPSPVFAVISLPNARFTKWKSAPASSQP